jgi:membrane protein YdbS with pleckstrin-like domain
MESQGIYGPVLLTSHPEAWGFLTRYLLCLTPVFLAVFSLLTLSWLKNMVAAVPPILVQPLETIVPELSAFIDITLLLIAPIGIFLLFIYIGDAIDYPEIWIGASLTLLLSGIGVFYQLLALSMPTVSAVYLLTLFQWTAFLIPPSSVVVSIILIINTEVFRRSIRYTIMRDVVKINGGIWTKVEYLIVYQQIGRIMVKQNRLERFFHIGTIIAAGSLYSGTATGRSGTTDTNGTGKGFTLVSLKGAHGPLDCLYGIRDPENAKALLEKTLLEKKVRRS